MPTGAVNLANGAHETVSRRPDWGVRVTDEVASNPMRSVPIPPSAAGTDAPVLAAGESFGQACEELDFPPSDSTTFLRSRFLYKIGLILLRLQLQSFY